MTIQHDPVIANARRNRGQWVAYLALALAAAAAIAGVTSYVKSEDTQTQVEASNPCVDVAPGRRIELSDGCRAIVDNVHIFCARNPRYCRESERRAVALASREVTQREFGAAADADTDSGIEGGDRSPGNDPRSPQTPSQPPQSDGDNGGQTPTTPETPATPETPTPDDGNQDNGGNEETSRQPVITVPEVQDIIRNETPQLCEVPVPIGPPIIKVC